jgi:hypothetical protein
LPGPARIVRARPRKPAGEPDHSVATTQHPLIPWGPLQADGSLLRREYALVYRAGLLNETDPVEVPLRDKLYNFAHLLTTAGNSDCR